MTTRAIARIDESPAPASGDRDHHGDEFERPWSSGLDRAIGFAVGWESLRGGEVRLAQQVQTLSSCRIEFFLTIPNSSRMPSVENSIRCSRKKNKQRDQREGTARGSDA